MMKSTAAVSFLAVVASATIASANPKPQVQGSDTLEDYTRLLIEGNCGGAANAGLNFSATPGPLDNADGLKYVGGGSGTAVAAMLKQILATAGEDQMAGPMSRALTVAKPVPDGTSDCEKAHANWVTAGSVGPDPLTTAQGVLVGLDGVNVAVNSGDSAACSTVAHTGPGAQTPGKRGAYKQAGPLFTKFTTLNPSTGVSTATGWRETLRLLYTGLKPTDANPTAAPLNGDCKNADRVALVNDYAKLYDGGCTTNRCTAALAGLNGIKHAYRRGDLSGTTDTFLGLVAAPSVIRNAAGTVATATPFCNGLEGEDKDPIRRDCTNDEQVCEASGDLGVVLPIAVPTFTQDPAVLFNASGALADSPKFGVFTTVVGTNCLNPPDPTPDPSGTLPVAGAGVLGWNLPAGWKFTNLARCDCRYPVPGNYLAMKDAANANVVGVSNLAFSWNLRSGGCPVTQNTAAGTPPTLLGMVHGDEPSGSDSSPAAWGGRVSNGNNLLSKNGGLEVKAAKQRCCNSAPFTLQSADPNFATTNPGNWRMDPRAMNLLLRSPTAGTLLNAAGVAGNNPGPAAFYRIHASTKGRTAGPNRSSGAFVVGAPLCQDSDATRLLGCLTNAGFYDTAGTAVTISSQLTGIAAFTNLQCSVAFAGREATEALLATNTVDAEPLAVNGVDPTVANVQHLVNPRVGVAVSDPDGPVYPLARKLYLNTFTGFAAIPNPNGKAATYKEAQHNLYKCMADQPWGATVTALAAAGFVTVPAINGAAAGSGLENPGPKMCNNMCSSASACDAALLAPVPAADLAPAFHL